MSTTPPSGEAHEQLPPTAGPDCSCTEDFATSHVITIEPFCLEHGNDAIPPLTAAQIAERAARVAYPDRPGCGIAECRGCRRCGWTPDA